MPQMAIIQPATPKGPPQPRAAGAPGNKEQNTFSPHLDKAVSNNKKQQAEQKESRAAASSNTDKKASPEFNSQLQESPESLEPADTQNIAAAIPAASGLDGPDENPGQLSVPVTSTEKSKPIDIDTAFAQLQQAEASAGEKVLHETILTEFSPAVDNAIQPSAMSTGLSPAVANTIQPMVMSTGLSPAIAEPAVTDTIRPAAAKEQNALIDQLQRIIDQASETGTVTITKAANPTSVDSIRSNIHGVLLAAPPENSTQVVVPETAGQTSAAVNGLLIADADGVEQAGARPTQQLTGIRQDSQQQYFNANRAAKDSGDTNQNFQEQRQGGELPQQTTGTFSQNGQLSGLSSGSEQTNTFSQIVTTAQQTTTQSTGETAKPILLPSGTMVQEDEIIQQLSHKLQISSRQMDSRINLKLHPAELGSLKIDLTVKEGSIRANVIAQSQHTSEILEKNMAKLKTILENQGFTVDEISITAESESVSDFDLFDRQLFGQNDYTTKAQKRRREDEAVFTLADNVLAAPAMQTGVNVKI